MRRKFPRSHRGAAIRVVLAALAVALAGAGGLAAGYTLRGEDEAPTPAPVTTAADEGLPRGWTLCTNEAFGYAIGYPAGWSAPALSDQSACTFFDPEPIELPENSDVYGAALEVAPAQDTYRNIVRGLTDRRFAQVLERRDLAVAGRPAVRVEARATGEGLLDRGELMATYAIDRGATPPLVLRTIAEPGARWEQRQAVLDAAARTLLLFRPARSDDAEGGLPDAVERKHAALVAAAERDDYDALAELADPRGFTYTYGGPVPGGPAAYWRRLERETGDSPAEILVGILRVPYTLSRGIYVWPFAYDTPQRDVTAHERELLRPLGDAAYWVSGNYFGWRAGIESDGSWVFFVAGD